MMFPRRHRLHAFCLALPLAVMGVRNASAANLDGIFERMEPGSIIKDLLIPRYDRDKRPSMILRADRMVVETLKSFTAEKVTLHMITSETNKALDQSWFSMQSCRYDLNEGILRSDTPLEAVSANFFFHSQGLITTLQQQQSGHRAFLLPPVYGFLNPNSDEITAMNRTRQSLLLASMIATQAAAQDPASEPKTPTDAFFALSPRTAEIDARLLEFAKKNDITITPVLLPDQSAPVLKKVDEVPPMPKFSPALDAMGFACKGGVYYDSATSSLTLLKDVTVRNPEYAMTVNGQVKILFEEPPAPKPKEKSSAAPEEKKDDEKATPTNAIGKIKQLHGTGGVAFEATDKDGVKNFASGDEVIYEMGTEEMHLKGRKLIFQQGNQSRFESTAPDAWLRFNKKTKNFTMSDGWNARLSVPPSAKPDDKKSANNPP